MELNVGMYVRTKYGIKQIYEINENKSKWKYLYKLKKQDEDGCTVLGVLCQEDIIKASYNIIDLIEVGDYVNDELVNFINSCNEIFSTNDHFRLTNEDIKSIVTKEQFEQCMYKVGELEDKKCYINTDTNITLGNDYSLDLCLNNEVEIIDDKPSKIEPLKSISLEEFKTMNSEERFNATIVEYDKIEELRKTVNYLLEKSDSNE